MDYTSFLIAFLMAISTFYVNQRIHKMSNIKIIINSLFDIYAQENSFDNFDPSDAAKRLMDEIILIEKQNDCNFYINLELDKLKKLRLVYFHFNDKTEALSEIKKIKFQKLGRSFIVLSYFNIKLPYYEEYKNGDLV